MTEKEKEMVKSFTVNNLPDPVVNAVGVVRKADGTIKIQEEK